MANHAQVHHDTRREPLLYPTVAAQAPVKSSSSISASSLNSFGAVTALTDDPTRSNTLKRSRDDSEGQVGGTLLADAPAPKRRTKVELDVVYRIVVQSRQIGKVIGRVGHRIQKIREETKATIKIADAATRHEERVIIISSKDSDNIFCDAEMALHHIVSLILKPDDSDVEAQKVGGEHVSANTIRILIAGSQAGGLIGVNGQNIENLRISSGATITVLAENQLPLCASTHESDRAVQISGDIPAVLKAVVEIGCQLRDNPPKQVIAITPSNNTGPKRSQHPYVDPSSAEYVNLEILVPEAMVGGLIGRCGSNISRIRTESGATIKVFGAKGEQSQRQIHLGGNTHQVSLAKLRIDEYVYSQLMLQSGAQPPMPTMPSMPSTMYQTNTLMQGYGHSNALYPNSNLGGAMMVPQPSVYTTTSTNQAAAAAAAAAAAYYGQTYQPPPM